MPAPFDDSSSDVVNGQGRGSDIAEDPTVAPARLRRRSVPRPRSPRRARKTRRSPKSGIVSQPPVAERDSGEHAGVAYSRTQLGSTGRASSPVSPAQTTHPREATRERREPDQHRFDRHPGKRGVEPKEVFSPPSELVAFNAHPYPQVGGECQSLVAEVEHPLGSFGQDPVGDLRRRRHHLEQRRYRRRLYTGMEQVAQGPENHPARRLPSEGLPQQVGNRTDLPAPVALSGGQARPCVVSAIPRGSVSTGGDRGRGPAARQPGDTTSQPTTGSQYRHGPKAGSPARSARLTRARLPPGRARRRPP